ncbi:MAG TPA: SH3 domain-containing protein [Candidatus Acidoferrales bacterium]|jgi:uncharacterized protein YgiM (DUF1202 family)|nr:SH3 domain-containing protein [Candidatus Acidoferrales bacterium]
MKLNCWLMLAVMVATGATAQNSTNSLPSIPPPASGPAMVAPAPALATPPDIKTNAPAKKAVVKKKKAATKAKAKPATAKTPALTEAPATLVAGPAEVVVKNVNVRGQAGLKGEVIAHLQKGDTVTVLSQIALDKHKTDEPAQWAKIALPTNVTVWVDSKFIDATAKTVTPKKLNLRAGPGENYSVLGVLEHGAVITESGAKGDWTKIEAPANAYAFIAAMYLKQEASGNVPVNPPPSTETTPPTPMTVAEAQPIVTTPPPAPEPVPMPVVNVQTNIVVVADTNEPPPPPRVVTHEGAVRSSVSIVAPTYFELYDPVNNKAINYLYSSTTNLNLGRYEGMRVIVTGEEGLDARWRQTPVLTVHKILIEATNTGAATSVSHTPRTSFGTPKGGR